MNERLRELMLEAGYAAPELAGRAKRLAELIVQDCCNLLKDSGESWEQFSRNPPHGQSHNASGALFAAYRLKEDAVYEIKEHFGVEQ